MGLVRFSRDIRTGTVGIMWIEEKSYVSLSKVPCLIFTYSISLYEYIVCGSI